MLLRLSSAERLPTSGSEPAPWPWVIFSPICSFWSALETARACLSVLMAMNSTPWVPAFTIRFTTLLPAPPTPTTFRVTTFSGPASALKSIMIASCIFISVSCGLMQSRTQCSCLYYTIFSLWSIDFLFFCKQFVTEPCRLRDRCPHAHLFLQLGLKCAVVPLETSITPTSPSFSMPSTATNIPNLCSTFSRLPSTTVKRPP